MTPILRPLLPSDVEEVARMQAGLQRLPPALARLAVETLRESPLAVMRVAEHEGRAVGFALVTTDAQRLLSDLISRRPLAALGQVLRRPRAALRVLRSKKAARLLVLYVEPGYRGQGLGLRLLAEAVEEVRLRGVDELWLAAPDEATGLRRALAERGFEPAEPGWLVRRRLGADPGWRPGPFAAADRLRCLLRLELAVILPIYGLALIPFASLLAWLGVALDRRVGLPPMLPEPWNLLGAALLLGAGGFLLLWSYTYLILEGEGGPVPPFSSKTRRLVTTGPYSVVRHPSILAKLMGVVGLGLAFNSWTFTCGIVPMLLCWSVLWNFERQDKDLVRVFGEEYTEYRRRTPMLFPRLPGSRR